MSISVFRFAHIGLPAFFVGVLSLALAPTLGQYGFQKFVDELPTLPRIQAEEGAEITIRISQIQAQFHRDLPPQPAWGYNGSSPGPVIEVESGHQLRVHWKNELPAKHIFAAPAGAMTQGQPDTKAVTHLHGLAVQQNSTTDKVYNNDGWPDLWTVTGEEQITEYPNTESARLLWYHDHSLGDTGRNVAAGLAGMYIIRDDFERSLNLPSGNYEVPLIIQGQGFNADGSRFYTRDISAEFYGNSTTVNGKLYPYMNVEPRKYRFRILNGSNARTYALQLLDFKSLVPGPKFFQVGSDGGFLQDLVVLNDPDDPDSPRLTLAPAERADVVIDFSKFAGHDLLLHNNSLDPGDGEMPLPHVMLFKVGSALPAPDTSEVPSHLQTVIRYPEADAVKVRRIEFGSMKMADGHDMLLLNHKAWHDKVEEFPVLGSTEIWELVNTLPDAHPFHIHLIEFQVLDRRSFDVAQYAKTGAVVYVDTAVPPDGNEMGWKDVVRVTPGMVTRIIMKFGPYAGHYVYHCHILEHEDMDMMRPFDVIAPTSP